MALASGTRLGPYDIVAGIGAGGMGEVYRAHDARLGRDVAIKVLPAAYSADPDRLKRFEQEARAAAALNHPNILAVYDIGNHDGAPYIVSELLQGATLRTNAALPARKATQYAVQIVRGLAAAHDRGIIHRDLKPDNVFVTTDGHVKILDFGLAKLVQAEPGIDGAGEGATKLGDTHPGMLLGTMGYTAPEQARGQTVDHRTDIFALGAVLYEMLSGHRAFEGPTPADTITAILEKDPPDLSLVEGHIPQGLARIVGRCLEKNQAARFQSTRDLVFALEALETTSGVSASSAPLAARGAHERKWKLVAVVSLLAAIVAVAGLVISYFLRPVVEPLVTRLEAITPATDEPLSFALSPDGRQLAFVANGDVPLQLWVRPLDSGIATPIQGTGNASYPFWKPDGSAIGFFADGKLKRVDLKGGAPQELAPASQGRGGTWSKDDVIVFATGTVGGLYRVSAKPGAEVAVATELGAGEVSHRWPQFLPDGRRFIYFSALGDTNGEYLVSLDGGAKRLLLQSDSAAEYVPQGYLLVASQGVLTARKFDPESAVLGDDAIQVAKPVGGEIASLSRGAFSVSDSGDVAYRSRGTGLRHIVWVDHGGKTAEEVTLQNDLVPTYLELSRDGQRFAFSSLQAGKVDVWVVSRLGIPTKVTSGGGSYQPVLSPDGSQFVFRQASPKGKFDLCLQRVDGSGGPHILLQTDENKSPQDWSSGYLLFSSEGSKTFSDLWALPITTDGRPAGTSIPVMTTSADETQGQISPNGRWLTYVSNSNIRREVYVQEFRTGEQRQQISTSGGMQPRWSHKGDELYYIAADGRLTMVSMVGGQDARELKPSKPVALFSSHLAAGGNISTGGFTARAQYAVAPDGRFLLNRSVEEPAPPPIFFVLHWDALLKRK